MTVRLSLLAFLVYLPYLHYPLPNFLCLATGFALCPPDIQEFLIDRLGKWFQVEKLASLLWLPDINATFLFEIFAQTLKLPREKQRPQERFYNTFYKILFLEPIEKMAPAKLQNYQIKFIELLPQTWKSTRP